MSKDAILVLGNQLGENPLLDKYPDAPIIMIEADDLCRKYTYHKHKLMLVLAGMRTYADNLKNKNRSVAYTSIRPGSSYANELRAVVEEHSISNLHLLQPTDSKTTPALQKTLKERSVAVREHPNTEQFMLTPDEFQEWTSTQKSPLMENFYRWHRKRTGVLMEDDGQPMGDAWNFDKENRKPLPKDISVPELPTITHTKHVSDVSTHLEEHFSENPGSCDNFWLPTSNEQAADWLKTFFEQRFKNFGPYEDAMDTSEPFLFHSILSPLINIGLLNPTAVVRNAEEFSKANNTPLNSVEGFIRQIMGWREYMYGLYRTYPEQWSKNYFGFSKKLEDWWYTSEWQNQNLPTPVSSALQTVHTYGYNHHIERLMVLGNWFLLNEYNPQSVYKWFSSLYVDAYDWVMAPNVIGMSQYADGGFVATKPYISGSNYLHKMSNYWPNKDASKDSPFTQLYWNFLNKHRDKLKDNPRMSLVLSQASKYAD